MNTLTPSHPEILLLFSSKSSHKVEQQAIPMMSKKSAKMNNRGMISIPKEKESEKILNARWVRNTKTTSAFKIKTTLFAFLMIISFK